MKIPGVFGTWNQHKQKEHTHIKDFNLQPMLYIIRVYVERSRTVSYHNVVIHQLEAVEDPGGGSEESGYSQREGEALHVTAAHYRHLKERRQQLNYNIMTCNSVQWRSSRCAGLWVGGANIFTRLSVTTKHNVPRGRRHKQTRDGEKQEDTDVEKNGRKLTGVFWSCEADGGKETNRIDD